LPGRLLFGNRDIVAGDHFDIDAMFPGLFNGLLRIFLWRIIRVRPQFYDSLKKQMDIIPIF